MTGKAREIRCEIPVPELPLRASRRPQVRIRHYPGSPLRDPDVFGRFPPRKKKTIN